MSHSIVLADDRPPERNYATDRSAATQCLWQHQRGEPLLQHFDSDDMTHNTTGWHYDTEEKVFAFSDVSPIPFVHSGYQAPSTSRRENRMEQQQSYRRGSRTMHRERRTSSKSRHSSNSSTSEKDETVAERRKVSHKDTVEKQRSTTADDHQGLPNGKTQHRGKAKQKQRFVEPMSSSDSEYMQPTDERRHHRRHRSPRHHRSPDNLSPQPHHHRKAMEVRRYNRENSIDEQLAQFKLTSEKEETVPEYRKLSSRETVKKRSNHRRSPNADYHRGLSNSDNRHRGNPKHKQCFVEPMSSSDGEYVQPTDERQHQRRQSTSRYHRSTDNLSPQPHHHQKAMEIRRYNGKDSIDEYLAQFELASRYNKWNDNKKATALLCALDGAARSILADFDDPTTTSYCQVKESLLKRFSTTDLAEVHESALSQLRLSRGQSVRELASEVTRLTRKAYSELDVKQRERFAIKWLLNAIGDKDTVFYIKDKEPPTMDKACTLYERYDALRGPGSRRIAAAKFTDSPDVDEQPSSTRCTSYLDFDKLHAENQEQIRQLTSAFQKLSSVVDQHMQPVNGTQGAWQAVNPPGTLTNSNVPRKPCPLCHLVGHWKRDCPQLKSTTGAGCFECHNYGHQWRNCPHLQSGNGRGSTSAPNARSAGQAPIY